MTWGTTDGFLDHFGLTDIRDLPGMDDLKAAGLLDSGPAISAYRVSGDVAESQRGNGSGDDEPLLPLEPVDEDAEEPIEALDPDGGAEERL